MKNIRQIAFILFILVSSTMGKHNQTAEQKFNLKQVYTMGTLGLTDEEIARVYDVDESTINKWKKKYPEFAEHLKKGKDEADNEVVMGLRKRAKGYKYTEVTKERKITNGKRGSGAVYEMVVTKEVTKDVVPDVLAGMYWMNNRRKHSWSRANEKPENGGLTSGELEAVKKVAAELMEKLT